MRSVHQPQIVELRGGRWMVECLACRSDHRSEVPIGIGLALPDRLTAERLAENHARTRRTRAGPGRAFWSTRSWLSRRAAPALTRPVAARSWRRGPAPARRRRGSPGPSCSSWSALGAARRRRRLRPPRARPRRWTPLSSRSSKPASSVRATTTRATSTPSPSASAPGEASFPAPLGSSPSRTTAGPTTSPRQVHPPVAPRPKRPRCCCSRSSALWWWPLSFSGDPGGPRRARPVSVTTEAIRIHRTTSCTPSRSKVIVMPSLARQTRSSAEGQILRASVRSSSSSTSVW